MDSTQNQAQLAFQCGKLTTPDWWTNSPQVILVCLLHSTWFVILTLLNWEFYSWFQRDFTYCPAFMQTSWPLVKCTKSLKQRKSSAQNILSNFKTSLFSKLQLLEKYLFFRSLQTCWVFFLLNYQPIPLTVTADFLPHSRIFNRA